MNCFGLNLSKKNICFGNNITNLPSGKRKLAIFGQKEVLVVKVENSMSI